MTNNFSFFHCSMSGFTTLHTNFNSQTYDGVCGGGPRQDDVGFTSGRVIILIRLQHEGLEAAASVTVCLSRLLEVLDRDAASTQQHPYPKAPWPIELPPHGSSAFILYRAAPSLNPDLGGRCRCLPLSLIQSKMIYLHLWLLRVQFRLCYMSVRGSRSVYLS